MSALVCQVAAKAPHPDADNLELVWVSWQRDQMLQIVTGYHYRIGHMGVYVAEGSAIPGYLAEDAWLVGRGKSNQWFRVKSKVMRGVDSPGLFFGQFYEKDTRKGHTPADLRAEERANLQKALGNHYSEDMPLAVPVYEWRYWRSHWKLGEDVSAYLGII